MSADDWENAVRPSLRGMPRAIFAPVAFVRWRDGIVTLAVPNSVHREKCEQHRAAVEQALSAHVGAPVRIELVEGGGDGDGGGGGGGSDPTPRVAPAPPVSVSPSGSAPTAGVPTAPDPAPAEPFVDRVLPDDDDVDLDDLVDAPPESVKTPIDRLAEAFPGSELIEEAG